MTIIDHVAVITLDRTPDRFAKFIEVNAHLPIERVSGVDGQALDRWDSVDEGLITPGNPYKLGALGSAVSHIRLWKKCVAENRAIHVAEDDAIFRYDFISTASAMLSALSDWDVVLWSWNFDWPLEVVLGEGLGPIVLTCNEKALVAEWRGFQSSTVTPLALRLRRNAGIPAYSVSPHGAKELLSRSLPVAGKPSVAPGQPNTSLLNRFLDIEMTRHYPSLQAFVSVPCLAVSLNVKSESTIQ